ncbi:putative disease resistance protein At3g14460 [Telopea speciosissima]|uniref:putative disease resistance protein At3g14460 n=1 Tax=Telopea speciosissima TaxID=54955 RepID=UPI001CC58D4D|nr:putative disease resistance protein At3g14460 [Telopea speciosissima]
MSSASCEKDLFSHFFKRWSSATKAITENSGNSNNIKEQFKKIEKELIEIERSLSSINKWEKSVMKMFQDLDQIADYLIKDLTSAASSSNKPHAGMITKDLNDIAGIIGKIKIESQPFHRLPMIHKAINNGIRSIEPEKKWQKLESEEDIMASPAIADAQSIYDNLEPRLQICFLCLSIFPENSIIRKRSLIYWWIGEDLVGHKEVEQVGEDCFMKLCESGLIEPISAEHSRAPHSCRLHPWVRRMAIRIAKETMFFDFDSHGKPISGPSMFPRRACVATTEERIVEQVDLEPDPSKLTMLFNIDVHCLECNEEEFKKLKSMEILQLGRWISEPKHHIEVDNPNFLDHLGLLKNLRYLGLQGVSRITKLPESINEVSELRVLDLRACHNLEKLPSGIASLKKLTHLDVSKCYLLEYMPKGLDSLSELQFLNGFVISNLKRQDACKLSELTKLEKLQKLSISLNVETMAADGELKAVGGIRGLKTLTITWGGGLALSMKGKDRDNEKSKKPAAPKRNISFIEKAGKKLTRKPTMTNEAKPPVKISLLLPPNLTKLDLQCFPREEAPELRKDEQTKSLKKLYFRGGRLRSLSGIQEGGVVSKVKIVRLRFLQNFNIRRPELEEIFPDLKYAEILNCHHIKTSFLEEESVSRRDRDSASTSKGNAAPCSSINYKIDGVGFSDTSELTS